MRYLWSKKGLIVFFLVVGFMEVFGRSLLATDLARNLEIKKYHPKLESVLGRLAEEYSQSRTAAQRFAGQRSIPLENDQVRVILVPPPGEDTSAIDQTTLVLYGVTIEAISRHLMRARIPISLLEEIADKAEGISYIRLPYQPSSDMSSEESIKVSNSLSGSQVYPQQVSLGVISEGVELTGASDYHDLGYKGEGTKVAVIDAGFNNLTNSQNNGELPGTVITKDFTGTGLETGRDHGTGVAEIVYDMAPGVQLYLIKIADEVDLENAKDYCIGQGIDIINHSWVWENTNFTDGTGLICDIANDARSKGILWVNAAGNYAKSHYQGFFADADNDGWHEFSTEDETNDVQHEGESLDVYLTWDSWPTTDQDYDLYLYDSDFNLIGSSVTRQTGPQPPTEEIRLSDLPSGNYFIMVKKYGATGDQEIKIFSNFHLEYQTPQHSLDSPADATGAIAVGYIEINNWSAGPQGLDSSQGPTNDGRIKPDIMGPAGVSSFTWGIGDYTSAATAHVSGAAALILSRCPGYSVGQLQLALEGWAVNMGSPGKDNIYGFGRLRLLAPSLLSWTGETDYESDGLNPEKGDTSTDFVYRIKYTNENNYAPKDEYPKVHILKNGFGIAGSPFTMNGVDPTDTTYTDGKVYSYIKNGLVGGTDYTYYFEAYDVRNGVLAVGAPTGEKAGPLTVIPANLENLIVYPNPFSPWKGHSQINFDGLTSDAKIRIFTLTGKLLKEEEVSWQYSWTWLVKNMTGEELARGIYLWIVTNTAGGRRIGKIAIIR